MEPCLGLLGRRAQPCDNKVDHLIKRRGGLIGKFSDELRMDEPQHGGKVHSAATPMSGVWNSPDATRDSVLTFKLGASTTKNTISAAGLLVPKPFVSVEPTGPSVYRTVDREHPTLIIDEADDLFYRKSDLRAIVNAG